MHKWTVLTVLLVAAVAFSNAQSRRYSRSFRMRRPASSPFQMSQPRQIIAAAPSYGGAYISPFGVPAYNMPMMGIGIGGRRILPDGEYYGPHGKTTVDGSDISYDHNSDYMMAPMIG